MNELGIDANEIVMATVSNAFTNSKKLSRCGDLILTDKNLIWVTRSLFGKVKYTKKIPLTMVKVFNDQAMLQLEEKMIDPSILTIQLKDETFTVTSTEKKAMRDIVRKATEIITGGSADGLIKSVIPSTEQIADTAKVAANALRSAFNNKFNKQPKRVSIECKGCGYKLSGFSGKTIRCPYCDSQYTV